ncbi:Alpha/Beta hydrolase protein [Aspergillus pseudotamarii]|uniref:Alpha/Beta hydrolase protein n=1 Tax=Aspergillus pseudotamarii TaxID=132259 RepID=A0A5N6TCF8_ASPPS|nr:Alpha/Beta hydrolase protein [Aspergillus pseudotamarii]KAE8143811.1 Alpha/Beta hydrolase protein [Aspergillus pseudotamarii]
MSCFPNSRCKARNAWIKTCDEDSEPVRIAYIDCEPEPHVLSKGVLLLIHGFPQTSYQFRHVIQPFADEGFRVIAPDYRGAGQSSHPSRDFRKSTMARDLFLLVHDNLLLHSKVHLVGHDIGGMIAHAYASQYPEYVASIVWGECPLPGTSTYDENLKMPEQFHFMFHRAPDDLALYLVSGKERAYIKYFLSKQTCNAQAILPADLEYYTLQYSKPGALRCAFEVYQAFEEDSRENKENLRIQGKSMLPVLVLSGAESRHALEASSMVNQVYGGYIQTENIASSGHYIAEENPEEFLRAVLCFVNKYSLQ